MRIISLGFALSFLTYPVLADDLTAPLKVTAVTIYSQGANVTYLADVDLVAGSHRVMLPYETDDFNHNPPRLKVSNGVRIGAINYIGNAVYDQDALLDETQTAAKLAVEMAKDRLVTKQSKLRAVKLQLGALDAQQKFLHSISGAEMANADPAQLQALAQMVRKQAEAEIAQRLELERQLRDLDDDLRDLTDALAEAERLFDRLSPPAGQGGMMAVSVEVATAVSARFEVVRIVNGARWNVDYDLRLTYGDDPALMVERKVVVEQATGQAWSNIDLVLSTANPFAQSDPSNAGRNLAMIYKYQPAEKLSSGVRMSALPAMMEEEVVHVEELSIMASAVFDGLSLRYAYPRKVTLGSNETVQLVLDSFALPVDTSLLAIPRRDQTAFVMAAITNNTGEPLLPGTASFYRDGDFIGRGDFTLIPAGAKADLSFGAMEGVRLTYTDLRRETGDSGIITTSNTREDVVAFAVENLTDKTQDVRVLYALPFSQQEDLVVSNRIRPNPSEIDVDDARGVAAWDMIVPAGQTTKVRLTTDLSWPKGFELNWAQ